MTQVKTVAENDFPLCRYCNTPIDYGPVLVDSTVSSKKPLDNLVHVNCAWNYLVQNVKLSAVQLKQYELVH